VWLTPTSDAESHCPEREGPAEERIAGAFKAQREPRPIIKPTDLKCARNVRGVRGVRGVRVDSTVSTRTRNPINGRDVKSAGAALWTDGIYRRIREIRQWEGSRI
jgi:hypothetical protein